MYLLEMKADEILAPYKDSFVVVDVAVVVVAPSRAFLSLRNATCSLPLVLGPTWATVQEAR